MKLFCGLLIVFNFYVYSHAQEVTEGVGGHWLDTDKGVDVSEKGINKMLWVPDPVAIRVSNKEIVFMSSHNPQKIPLKPSLYENSYENKRVIYKYSGSRATQLKSSLKRHSSRKEFVAFLENWGNACSGDRGQTLVAKNRIHQLPFRGLSQVFSSLNPDIFIFQYRARRKKFKPRLWEKFLKKIPSNKGCFLISDEPQKGGFQKNFDYSLALENLIRRERHHCQVIHRGEESGYQEIIRSICDRDYRSSMVKNR